jgi:hypothetical protein
MFPGSGGGGLEYGSNGLGDTAMFADYLADVGRRDPQFQNRRLFPFHHVYLYLGRVIYQGLYDIFNQIFFHCFTFDSKTSPRRGKQGDQN